MVMAAWLLLVTGIYTGSMAPGVEVLIRLDAPARDQAHCESMKRDFIRKMRWLGAKNVTADCIDL